MGSRGLERIYSVCFQLGQCIKQEMARSAGRIERGKLLDASLAAVILIIFSAVPLGVRLGDVGDLFPETTAEVAYTGCVGVSWFFFLAGAVALFVAWLRAFKGDNDHRHDRGKSGIVKGRKGDRCMVELGYVSMVAVTSVLLGSLLLLAAVVTATVQQAQAGAGWLLAADAASICVLLWCGATFIFLLRQARLNAVFPSNQRRGSKSVNNSVIMTRAQDLSVHSDAVVALRSGNENIRNDSIPTAPMSVATTSLSSTVNTITASSVNANHHLAEEDEEAGNSNALLDADSEDNTVREVQTGGDDEDNNIFFDAKHITASDASAS